MQFDASDDSGLPTAPVRFKKVMQSQRSPKPPAIQFEAAGDSELPKAPVTFQKVRQSQRSVEPPAMEFDVDDEAPATLLKEKNAEAEDAGAGAGAEAGAGFARLAKRPSFLRDGFCRSHPCSLAAAQIGGDNHDKISGHKAPLNEIGYRKVARLKDDHEMKDFIERVIERYDCRIISEGGLMGLVPWFSGTVSVQSYTKLEDALLFAILSDGSPWLQYRNSAGVTGADAELTLEGYVEVACTRNEVEMKKFTRRLCADMNIKIIDEGGFNGMIHYYSGSSTFQSFDSLKAELQSAAATPHTWAEFAEHEQAGDSPTLEPSWLVGFTQQTSQGDRTHNKK